MKKILLPLTVILLSSFALSYAQTYNVTFQVNMKVEFKKGKISGGDVVSVRGNFNDWGESNLSDADNDSIYTGTIAVEASKLDNGKMYYKFFSHGAGADNGGWETMADNRTTTVTGDVTLDVVWFNDEPMPSGNPANVTFNADMRLPIKQGDLIPGVGKVYVAGDFNGWNTTADELTDTDGDSVYSKTVQINSAQLIHYKFLYGNQSGGTTWENDPNKTFWIKDGDNTINRFFNDVNPNVTLRDGNISFYVDMSPMEEVGLFNSSEDSVQLRGSFNGWSSSDPTKSLMNQDIFEPSKWFIQVPFIKGEVGSNQFYKFRMQVKDQVNSPFKGDAGYERPLSTGGGNRTIPFEGLNDQTVPTAFFDDIRPDYVVPQGQSVSITLSVDMTPAMDPQKQAVPFNPATDTVYLVPGQAAWAAVMGWTEGMDRAVKFSDPDGDHIYTATITINGPAFNGFVYNYEFANADGLVKEPTSFDNNAWRVRFIGQNGYRSFVQPYTAPLDVWTNKADKSSQVEPYPDGYPTSVETLGDLPATYTLNQNYPNPFNPSTTISFALPKQTEVTLKVYNILGQEVSTLVNNQVMEAGVHKVNFGALNLASGVYFYTIKAGNFTATKKMLLLK
ncbi:T9SS type A sorting domain-containing protein [Melioribacteraceae bacterium 4301-Me]|uniref:T9SS type A sorting domain-containing protein n=1 Tax=Pyranulibacter aquaticus TaxID=3163344 RepID=UPI00359C04A7